MLLDIVNAASNVAPDARRRNVLSDLQPGQDPDRKNFLLRFCIARRRDMDVLHGWGGQQPGPNPDRERVSFYGIAATLTQGLQNAATFTQPLPHQELLFRSKERKGIDRQKLAMTLGSRKRRSRKGGRRGVL
jgi:hypothetical protein